MVYLCDDIWSRCTILVGNPRYIIQTSLSIFHFQTFHSNLSIHLWFQSRTTDSNRGTHLWFQPNMGFWHWHPSFCSSHRPPAELAQWSQLAWCPQTVERCTWQWVVLCVPWVGCPSLWGERQSPSRPPLSPRIPPSSRTRRPPLSSSLWRSRSPPSVFPW